MSSSSSVSSSDALALRETTFIRDIMRTTLAYIQENEASSSRYNIRNPPYGKIMKTDNQLMNDYFNDDAVYIDRMKR